MSENLVLRAARALQEAAEVSAGAAIDARQTAADCIGHRWRVRGRRGCPEIAHILVADRPGACAKRCARSRKRCPGMSAEPPGARRGCRRPVDVRRPSRPFRHTRPDRQSARAFVDRRSIRAAGTAKTAGPLGDWRLGRNDLEPAAIALVPQIETVLAWLSAQPGAEFIRMSGSGASCFALFDSEQSRDSAADRVPREWWRLATTLR